MKRITVKMQVTLWYLLSILLICGVMAGGMLSAVSRATRRQMEGILVTSVAAAAQQVEYENGSPRMEKLRGPAGQRVSFALMDSRGNLWQGHWPPFQMVMEDGSVRLAKGKKGEEWLVQDLFLPFDEGNLWLRGSLSMDTMGLFRQAAADGLMAWLPLLVLAAALGGYALTRRAFKPVSQMAKKAEKIMGGQDLEGRFEEHHPKHPDEFDLLARAFNRMLGRLEASFQREKQFTDDASHELRTPIAVISAASEYALSQQDEGEYRDALETIQARADEMNALVGKLLQLARMEGGRVQLHREQVDFSGLCRAAAMELGENSPKEVNLTAISENCFCSGDELMLLRVVMNLVENALKFAASTVSLSLEENEKALVLKVIDDGPGMKTEVLARIFDRFYQENPDRGSKRPGAGLGLPLSRQIVRLHGGDITAQSTEGKGTCMVLMLPKAAPEQKEKAKGTGRAIP